jgi:hypothetical protein
VVWFWGARIVVDTRGGREGEERRKRCGSGILANDVTWMQKGVQRL